ncbi:putative ABC transport system permease protein [Promicromonospora umidemergens]|uniref:ABC3 transporter permease C-terminal domain-containing protein n=1 Tax=Promicromonospora umidemergens TaxID=629679 RepID=A0ABP8XAX6_9MICO|nr:ABC transporter permease [Promicromonospora umidemergens]MCP2281489.1 putative ABC transport system permease protein [Promicromonospora umidemergens]
MWSFARSAVRAYRSSFIGSFLIVMAAAALLSANGVLVESGLRGDAPLLTTVAASFAGTAILVVVLVVASTFASALRQRNAQFALLRAVGATTAQVRSMVTAEVTIVFALAAPLGAVPGLFAARLLTPVLESGGIVPGGLGLTISPLPVIGSLLLLFPTALLAARLAAREVTKVSPTAAVRGASAESAGLSGVRRVAAVTLLASGILVAGTPFIVPGTLGSAAGATSAFLLISAAALAGPAIVGTIARRAARATRSSSNAAAMLALVNSRGFSRRITAAIIPLALFLALGTVQTGVNGSMVDAAGMQLRAGLGSDVIITSPDGVTAEQAAAVGSTPGIDAVVASSTVPAEVKVEDEDLGGLSWEQTGLRAVTGSTSGLVDAEVTAGSLDDLAGPATIAVSGESLFATGKSVGDTVELRFDGGAVVSPTIVAVYDRGLGLGSYIIDESSLPGSVRPAAADLLFAQGSADLAHLGLRTVSVDDYVDETAAGAAAQQELGAILLFVLIFFLAIAAANTLVMLTSARKPEFALLRRVGTTRRQLTSMISIESVFVMVMALVIGTLSVVPALVGVAYGMLGRFALAIDWPVYGALAGAVVLIASAAMMVPARVVGRVRAGAQQSR